MNVESSLARRADYRNQRPAPQNSHPSSGAVDQVELRGDSAPPIYSLKSFVAAPASAPKFQADVNSLSGFAWFTI